MSQPLLLTANEAGAITGLTVRKVNKLIDEQLPRRAVRKRDGRRVITMDGVVCLEIDKAISGLMTVAARKKVFAAIAESGARKRVEVGPYVTIAIAEVRRELRDKLAELRYAMTLIERDKEVLGGTPCFRGTRIPVYLIKDLLDQGADTDEIREDYPALSGEMIDAIPLFCKAFPRRGRPPSRPWNSQRPISVKRSARSPQ